MARRPADSRDTRRVAGEPAGDRAGDVTEDTTLGGSAGFDVASAATVSLGGGVDPVAPTILPVDSAAVTYITGKRLEPIGAAPHDIAIDRYQIIGVIGAGGMGIVYAARDPELGRQVAIKVLRPEMSANLSANTLIAEAQTMARLNHPNVCTVYEVGTVQDSVFLAMEYVDGRTLSGWLEDGPRTWRQIVDIMIAAGRGVEAAHAAGIIHRDLKPENIMIGRDGRVRVMDFGIATRAARKRESEGMQVGRRASMASLIGTPAYMAPELLRGQSGDELSDQFAFAVTLYEALFGERPYRGRTIGELNESYDHKRMHSPPSKVRVPRWLRQAILRGAATETKRRYDSVGAMVAELERIPRVRRTWQITGLTAALVVLGVLITIVWYQRELAVREACPSADERLAGAWNDEHRAAVEQALARAGIPNAAGQWHRVAKNLDAYSERWSAMYTQACEATRVRGEQSEAMLDRRMLCLDARRKELSELVAALTLADRGVAQRAVEATLALADVDRCSARRELLDAPPEPDDKGKQAILGNLRARLAAARIQYNLGRYARVRAEVEAISTQAVEVGYDPTIANARLLEGRVLAGLDQIDRSERAYVAAWLAAERSGDDRTKLEALGELVMLMGFESRRHTEGRRWESYADATLTRVGDAPRIEIVLLRGKNGLDMRSGNYAIGDQFERAHELSKKAFGPEHPMVAQTLGDIASRLLFLGLHEESLRYQKEALTIAVKALGEHHPMAAEITNNMGNAYFRLNDLDEARSHYQRALATWEAFFGSTHSRVAIGLTNLGNVSLAQDEVSEAIELYERALDIEERLLGVDHPNSVPTMLNLGIAHGADFNNESALAILRRALVIVGAAATQESAEVRFELARALYTEGQTEEARELAQAALTIYDSLGGEFQADRAEVANWLARPN